MFLFVNLNITLFHADMYFFYVRQHICYSAYMVRQFRPSVRLSVRMSVTHVDFIKTAQYIIEILSLSDRPMILVFITKGGCVNLTVSPLSGLREHRIQQG